MKRIHYLLLATMLLCCLLSEVRPAAANTSGINLARGPYLVLANEDAWKWSPDVAYDSNHDRYLVVWEVLWPSGHHSIYGRLVSASGQLSSEFVVFDDVYNSKQPAVAYDKIHDRYLVVWSYARELPGSKNCSMKKWQRCKRTISPWRPRRTISLANCGAHSRPS